MSYRIEIEAAKRQLIEARKHIERGNLSAAILEMKWAMERLLPDGQQYCSQTLPDNDPDKTLQWHLDQITAALRTRAGEK